MNVDQAIVGIIAAKKNKLNVIKKSQPDYLIKIKKRLIYYCQNQMKKGLSINEVIGESISKLCLHQLR